MTENFITSLIFLLIYIIIFPILIIILIKLYTSHNKLPKNSNNNENCDDN